MTRQTRNALIGVAVVAALAGAEVALQFLKDPEACVQVDNQGTEPIEGLVVSSGPRRTVPARVEPGGSVRLLLSGRGPQMLRLSFRQANNPITAYEMPGFDPELMTSEGSKLVLQVKRGEVVRFQDEGDPTTPAGFYVRGLWRRVWGSLTTPP